MSNWSYIKLMVYFFDSVYNLLIYQPLNLEFNWGCQIHVNFAVACFPPLWLSQLNA